MLPITLLNAAQGQEISVECKSGRKYTGRMQTCDLFMNVTLENVKCSDTESGVRTELPELYLRGYSLKYIKIPDQLLEDIVEERQAKRQELHSSHGNTRRTDSRR